MGLEWSFSSPDSFSLMMGGQFFILRCNCQDSEKKEDIAAPLGGNMGPASCRDDLCGEERNRATICRALEKPCEGESVAVRDD